MRMSEVLRHLRQQQATTGARPRLLHRYAAFLPVGPETPPLSLGEGVHAAGPRPHARPRHRLPGALPQVRGHATRPARSRTGAWSSPSPRRSRRARGRSSVPPPATPRRRLRPTARARASRWSSCSRPARSRPASCSRPRSPGRGSSPSRATSTTALRVVRELAASGARSGHPVTLVNSVNPYRLAGPEDRRVRGLRRPGRSPRLPRHPGRQRRQHQRLLGGLHASTVTRGSSRRGP